MSFLISDLHQIDDYLLSAKNFIFENEGPSSEPYFDPATPPYVTIGYGFNIDGIDNVNNLRIALQGSGLEK